VIQRRQQTWEPGDCMRRCLFDGNDPESARIVEYHRDRLTPNPVVAQGQTVINRNRPGLRFENPLVAGSNPARPTSEALCRHDLTADR
jgi:hypothetical protein